MSFLQIEGGYPLYGEIKVQGSKNAALPILAACVLIKGTTVLTNCPDISDVACMVRILQILGCKVERRGHTLTIDASNVSSNSAYKEEAGKMRSSVMLVGALLGRCQEAFILKPGGCCIGERKIDIHEEVFTALGITLVSQEDGIQATMPKESSKDCEFTFSYPSVGATENGILASVLRQGRTILRGAAKEPEIVALCKFLNQAGASIKGAGSNTLIIEGTKSLQESSFTIPGDRIAALTYLAAGAITKGKITVTGVEVEELSIVNKLFGQMGIKVTEYESAVSADMTHTNRLTALPLVKTEPYPGFPTDMQSQIMSLCCLSDGISKIDESIFEDRFQTVKELSKMGAEINIYGNMAVINGRCCLHSETVYARDLRGGAALILAALAAEGESHIGNMFYVERGYETVTEVLTSVGARASMLRLKVS